MPPIIRFGIYKNIYREIKKKGQFILKLPINHAQRYGDYHWLCQPVA